MTTETKTQDANSAMLPAAQEEGGALVAMDFSAPFGGSALSEEDVDRALIEDAGKGLESIPASSGFEPLIKLLQAMSAEVQHGTARIEGAKPGDIIFKETGQLFGEEVILVPCHYREAYVQWKPKTQGSGYVGEIPLTKEEFETLPFDASGNKTYRVTPEGLEIHKTCYYAVLASNANGGKIEQGVVAMAKSQVRAAQKWNRLITSQRLVIDGEEITPPIYGFTYLMGRKPVNNGKGSWFVWDVLKQARTPAALFGRARAYAKQIEAGLVEVGSDENPEDDARQAALGGKKADVSKGLAALGAAAKANAEEEAE